jgi:hypothetical protein
MLLSDRYCGAQSVRPTHKKGPREIDFAEGLDTPIVFWEEKKRRAPLRIIHFGL